MFSLFRLFLVPRQFADGRQWFDVFFVIVTHLIFLVFRDDRKSVDCWQQGVVILKSKNAMSVTQH